MLWFTGQNGVYGRLDPKSGQMAVFDAPRGTGPYSMASTASTSPAARWLKSNAWYSGSEGDFRPDAAHSHPTEGSALYPIATPGGAAQYRAESCSDCSRLARQVAIYLVIGSTVGAQGQNFLRSR